MFKEGGASEVVWGIADYWVSRVMWDPDEQQYHLKGASCDTSRHIYLRKGNFRRFSVCMCHLGVMPPDEYNKNVDNSVYTNTVAKYRCVYGLDAYSNTLYYNRVNLF